MYRMGIGWRQVTSLSQLAHNIDVPEDSLWTIILEELAHDLPDTRSMVRVTLRLLFALLFAAAIGWQRERAGKEAGLRTHMLVGLGSALFMVALSGAGATPSDLTRVAQGVATGIGFIGGGVILKLPSERRVKGLTTAASVWLAASVGVAAGAGTLGAGVVGLMLCLVVLTYLQRLEPRERRKNAELADTGDRPGAAPKLDSSPADEIVNPD